MRLWVLHYVARVLGIPIRIDGLPYGAWPRHHLRSGRLSQSAQR